MKHIQITLEDEEYIALIKIKGDTSWHDFLMQLSDSQESK